MKVLRTLEIDPRIEGGATTDGSIIVNIEGIWDRCDSVDEFVDEFIAVYIHECVHMAIRKVLPDEKQDYIYGEEVIVREMLGDYMTEREKKFYNDKRKNTNIGFTVVQ